MEFVSNMINENKDNNSNNTEGKQKGHQKKSKGKGESCDSLIQDDLKWLLKEIHATAIAFFESKNISNPNKYIFSTILTKNQELLVQNL